MRIVFHGAAQTVTGSQHLLEINGSRLLLECGLYQGRRDESYARNWSFPFDARSVDAVILSHAHIDHSGNLPNLVKRGFEGEIYTTHASADLSDVMLQDSGHIQEADAKYMNERAARKGTYQQRIEPLYTQIDAQHVKQHLHGAHYEEQFQPVPGVTARLVEAGHILGSAAVVLEIEEKGRKIRLWFSGDIGRYKLPLLRDPVMPSAADYLIMECTYGDRPHNDPQHAYEEFRQVVKDTVQRGGKVIIPAFAVGRTQELVYDLNQMMTEGEVPEVPVYVDSPLAVNASQVFRRHPEIFDAETQKFVQEARHPALDFKMLTYIQSVDESKALNERHDPMVIMSASGMAETGRILHHLKNNIENPQNTVCIVSWQAPNTLGRRLADREKQVRIYGEPYEVRAQVATIGGLSGHAGQDLLVKYACSVKDQVKQIFLVHGEPDAAGAFRAKLRDNGLPQTHYPALHEAVEI
jgi:metallo-beta-lactamase family protein